MAEINQDVLRTVSVLREAYSDSALVAFIVPKKYEMMFRSAKEQFTHLKLANPVFTHNHSSIRLNGMLYEGQTIIGHVSFQDVNEISLVPIMIEIEGEEYR